ncbi:aerotolerance regulator BatA [Flavobacterium akiainvivens]|uniref:Aerotolerance regulator BatA n=1 Tax=Flavobacterium akiainvivens TaxID=1202724 RepID=A0A0N0RQU8_9FLAO|nr:VWA domain-containing protein [Flavobacterium akiainvivens]KOS06899.1 aerotolerance regulator BatA [Flavobacterium akiainvivens]SFQ69626.1 Ca-activated chloride channel family protein [Flavobacterium akiainvivens]
MKDITFLNPEMFWLFAALPFAIAWYVWKRRQQTATLTVSSLNGFKVKPSLLARLKPVLFAFRILALGCIIVALARPRTVDINSKNPTVRGIDIVMAVDVSGSMMARDLKPDRLEALKKVAARFVDGRPNDRIGLVVYAGEAYTRVPVTSDKQIVKEAIRGIKYEDGVLADGTGIGVGLATAINRLRDSKAKSKVIILLTDGENNTGQIDPRTAADIAKEYKIKVYTIGVGTNGNAPFPVGKDARGKLVFQNVPVTIDEKLMKEIAQKTDGVYFRATSNSKLQSIYDQINKLETTEIKEQKFYNYNEKFRPWVWAAFGLLLVEVVARKTLYRSFI